MKIILFVILLTGSIYFLNQFIPDAKTTGSGDNHILILWSIRRCVVDLGVYVLFVSMIFGTSFFLKEISQAQMKESQNTNEIKQ